MTKLFEAYLKFVERNKKKLQKAVSADAYNNETFFKCFYDAARDVIYLHYDVDREFEGYISAPEEFDEYQSVLDDCVAEIEFAKTLD